MTRQKKKPAPRPCVFLDRDGTICKEAGYINHPLRLELLSGAARAIRRLNEAGVLVIVVTNQSGIARGYFTEEVLTSTHERMTELLKERGAHIDGIYFAPHHPAAKDPKWRDDPEELRKPGAGMIRKACEHHPIDLARSFIVGDRYNDIVFAHNAGLRGVFVKTGYGLGEWAYERNQWTVQPDYVCANLDQAARWILREIAL